MTSQALKYDVINYTIWRSKLHYFRQKYTTMKTCRWTTWNSNRLLQGRFQVSSVARAHRTIYSDWMQSFEACITEICSHSGWHYRFPVTIVTVRINEWEVAMITSPLLSNVRHKAMITPVSPLLTRLIILSRVLDNLSFVWNYPRNGNCPQIEI